MFNTTDDIGKGKIIAILDTGMDYGTFDVMDNIWLNPGEFPNADSDGNGKISMDELSVFGINTPSDIFTSIFVDGIDNEGNGFVDDFLGWNFGMDNNNPEDITSVGLHGTLISGVAAAVTDNQAGVAGVCWHCKIMSLKVDNNNITTFDASPAILYAVLNRAEIINMSFVLDIVNGGGVTPSKLMEDVILLAADLGVTLVAGAGNFGDDRWAYPASYSDVISVASTNDQDLPEISTSHGQNIDVAAPGEQIIGVTGVYTNGTSNAAPHVAGLAGLALSYHNNLGQGLEKNVKVRELIKNTSKPLNPGFEMGAGRVNAHKMLRANPDEILMSRITYPRSYFKVLDGSIDIQGYASGDQFDHYILSHIYEDLTNGSTQTTQIGSTQFQSVKDGVLLANWNTSNLDDGHHTLELKVVDINGKMAIDRTTFIVTHQSCMLGFCPAQMISPAPSTALPGGIPIQFDWDSGLAMEEFKIEIGSSLGTSNIHSQSYGINTSAIISNLPSGQSIFVRLLSKLAGEVDFWMYVDYEYQVN
jgi:subtilisin family serine protease